MKILVSLLSNFPLSKSTCIIIMFIMSLALVASLFAYRKKSKEYNSKREFSDYIFNENAKLKSDHAKELFSINEVLNEQRQRLQKVFEENLNLLTNKLANHADTKISENDNDLKISVEDNNLKETLRLLFYERKHIESLIELINDNFTDSHGEFLDIEKELSKKKAELSATIISLDQASDQLSEIQEEIIRDDEESLYQSYSLYRNKYEYQDSATYKVLIAENRNQQRSMIKNHLAVSFFDSITTEDGKTSLNKKFEKLYLSCFNSICDQCISELTFANHQVMRDKIQKSFTALNETFPEFMLEITEDYLELKISELDLVYESIRAKKIEQERIRAEKERQKEDAWVKKQLKEERESLSKEKQHYSKHLKLLREQFKSASEDERSAIHAKIIEHENIIEELNVRIQEADYRQINEKAGYVYIISNIGSFGENIYKIGMSRRLDPLERVDELSSASVPFRFDVHALIFSEDAYSLESALHSAFENKRVNMVNGRKEFYRVSLEEIENVVKKYHDQTVQFTKYPEAEQYRESIRMQRRSRI